MTQLAFTIDLGRCVGCNACRVACKEFRRLPNELHRRTVYQLDEALVGPPMRIYLSAACNHCDNPGCLPNCPTHAYTKTEDGVVLHNDEVCVGCKMCAWTCPFGVPMFNEEAGVMDKCDMCYTLQQAGEEPRCVTSCPMGALGVMDASEVPEGFERGVEGYPDAYLTNANIFVKKPVPVNQVRR